MSALSDDDKVWIAQRASADGEKIRDAIFALSQRIGVPVMVLLPVIEEAYGLGILFGTDVTKHRYVTILDKLDAEDRAKAGVK